MKAATVEGTQKTCNKQALHQEAVSAEQSAFKCSGRLNFKKINK